MNLQIESQPGNLSPLVVIYVFSINQVNGEQTPQKLIVLMLSRPLPSTDFLEKGHLLLIYIIEIWAL